MSDQNVNRYSLKQDRTKESRNHVEQERRAARESQQLNRQRVREERLQEQLRREHEKHEKHLKRQERERAKQQAMLERQRARVERETARQEQERERERVRVERETARQEQERERERVRVQRETARQERETARQERERERERSRQLRQARLRPALHCNMDSLVLFDTVHRYFHVGLCSFPCMYCGSLGFEAENRGNESQRHYGTMCCNKGKLMFEELPELPPTLHRLFTSDDRDAQHFRKNIRQFNAGMAMASFQANNKTVRGGAPAAFKVVGQVYRRIGDALAQHNREAKCLQVYFLDPDYQASLRASRYESEGRRQNPMDESIFRLLHSAITEEANNSYVV
jgi:DNA polymerase III alpha subunit (gram-positive type)